MKSSEPPEPVHLPDVMDGLESPRRAWKRGWSDGYRAALQAVTAVKLELPNEDPW